MDNEPLSSITHFAGFGLAIAGLVLMIVFAAKKGTAWHVVGFTLFGSFMVMLYLTSALYHLFCKTRKVKKVFSKIDHSMIYVMIAGTYTPICFIALKGAWGWSLFGIVWGIAVLGILFKILGFKNMILSTISYVVMGWLAVIAFVPLVRVLSPAALFWLIGGGVLYTIGAVIYGIDHKKPSGRKWFTLHDLFHLFVIGGSFCHFWLMLNYILYI